MLPNTITADVEQRVLFNKQWKPDQSNLADYYIVSSGSTTLFGLGDWRRYENGVWPAIEEHVIKAEIQGMLEDFRYYSINPTANLLSSISELVQVKLTKPSSLFDANPDIIVCANGTYDPTAPDNLREHRLNDYATTAVPFDYNPQAECPTWRYAVESSIPEVHDLLQEFFGYCLTPNTRYETALWFTGDPGSGKSTLIEGLQLILGDKCDVLGLSDVERNRFSLHRLQGKTALVSTEQPADYIGSSHILNALISGEKITVERKFQDSYTLKSTAKILWAMNDMPRIGNPNDGLYRRVRVVKFPHRPEEDRDPTIKEKIALEGSGILNWALSGLARLRENRKFSIPDSVKDATADFKHHNDIPRNFLEEACLTGPDMKTQSSHLYTHYRDWCEQNGHKAKSSTAIAEDWARLGLDGTKSDGKRIWRGVGLPAEL